MVCCLRIATYKLKTIAKIMVSNNNIQENRLFLVCLFFFFFVCLCVNSCFLHPYHVFNSFAGAHNKYYLMYALASMPLFHLFHYIDSIKPNDRSKKKKTQKKKQIFNGCVHLNVASTVLQLFM